jgi:hypothetical protein
MLAEWPDRLDPSQFQIFNVVDNNELLSVAFCNDASFIASSVILCKQL